LIDPMICENSLLDLVNELKMMLVC